MISWIVRKFTRDNVQKLTGSEREKKIPSFFMQGLLKDESRIQYWVSGIKMETGVGIRTVLPKLPFAILKRYSPPPIRVRQKM